jgi:AraC-like DNA-binding protein
MGHESSSLLAQFADGDAAKGKSAGQSDQDVECAEAVRRDWSHAVASALQPVVGEMLDVDGETFAEPFRRLADRTPAPVNVAERRDLKARFMEFALRLGSDFHARFHPTTRVTCRFLPVESTARIWFDSVADPRELLKAWASAYALEFARHHSTPVAWKAARELRKRCAQPADIQGLAVAIGASRAALMRDFDRTFGMTPGEYHARVRLAHGLTELRNRDTKVEHAARLAGFASVKNFNRAVSRHTAMMPSQIRGLPDAWFKRLLENNLQADPVLLAVRRKKQPANVRTTREVHLYQPVNSTNDVQVKMNAIPRQRIPSKRRAGNIVGAV